MKSGPGNWPPPPSSKKKKQTPYEVLGTWTFNSEKTHANAAAKIIAESDPTTEKGRERITEATLARTEIRKKRTGKKMPKTPEVINLHGPEEPNLAEVAESQMLEQHKLEKELERRNELVLDTPITESNSWPTPEESAKDATLAEALDTSASTPDPESLNEPVEMLDADGLEAQAIDQAQGEAGLENELWRKEAKHETQRLYAEGLMTDLENMASAGRYSDEDIAEAEGHMKELSDLETHVVSPQITSKSVPPIIKPVMPHPKPHGGGEERKHNPFLGLLGFGMGAVGAVVFTLSLGVWNIGKALLTETWKRFNLGGGSSPKPKAAGGGHDDHH